MVAKSRISTLLGNITPSATLAVTAKARDMKAAGLPVIGFGAGEPDFSTPDYIVEAAVKAARDSASHHYTAAKGLPALREAIAAKTLRDSGYEVDPNNILVTNGGKQAVFQAFAALLNPGDEVLLPTPYWTTYPEAIKLADGVPVPVMAGADQGYKVSVDQLEDARTDATKILLMCSPSNPTGAVYTPAELKTIGQWALERELWVVTDEIYEHLVYDGLAPTHIVHLVPELADQTLVLNGVAKTYAMTGWRVGWMIGPSDIIKGATSFQSHLTSNVCNVAQYAAIAAVSGPLDAVYEMREAFDCRRQRMVELLRTVEGMEVPTPHGAFYVYPDVTGLLGKEIAGHVAHTSADLAEIILKEANAAMVPGEAFGPSGFLRLSYSLSDADLEEGVGRIVELLNSAR
ncbi:MAG: pyridoxal phosphate-dependent aminotransferase [Actinomycetaceae bacterium]|nr:pyridoxal phosphate-dependent aminotransferase [Actinomycetaceae bacterium]